MTAEPLDDDALEAAMLAMRVASGTHVAQPVQDAPAPTQTVPRALTTDNANALVRVKAAIEREKRRAIDRTYIDMRDQEIWAGRKASAESIGAAASRVLYEEARAWAHERYFHDDQFDGPAPGPRLVSREKLGYSLKRVKAGS